MPLVVIPEYKNLSDEMLVGYTIFNRCKFPSMRRALTARVRESKDRDSLLEVIYSTLEDYKEFADEYSYELAFKEISKILSESEPVG